MSAIQLNALAEKHPHPRDEYISFEEKSHIYTIYRDGINQNGRNGDSGYTSVTTWNHQHFEPFDEDRIIDRMMNSKKWTNSKYYGMTAEQIKAQWEKTRLEASTAGTKLHEDIEKFYNDVEVENDSVEYKQFLAFEEMRKRRFPELEPYRTEWIIWHEDWRLAGSVDMIFRNKNTGGLWIYDWKRSREIKKVNPWQSAITSAIEHLPDTNFWHYALQLNTYRAMLEDKYDVSVEGMCLVCLHPEHESYQRIVVPDLSREMRELLKY